MFSDISPLLLLRHCTATWSLWPRGGRGGVAAWRRSGPHRTPSSRPTLDVLAGAQAGPGGRADTPRDSNFGRPGVGREARGRVRGLRQARGARERSWDHRAAPWPGRGGAERGRQKGKGRKKGRGDRCQTALPPPCPPPPPCSCPRGRVGRGALAERVPLQVISAEEVGVARPEDMLCPSPRGCCPRRGASPRFSRGLAGLPAPGGQG